MGQSERLIDFGRLIRVHLRRAKRVVGGNRRNPSVQPGLRSCIILGSGRSGTSMLAGSLADLGYYMGDNLYIAPREANPKGFFEDFEVNLINEALIARALPAPLARGRGWLTPVPLGTQFALRSSLVRRIVAQTTKTPFCFKDPRFCYTLPAWLPHLGDVAILCIFREPARTANSIVEECTKPYLAGIEMDFERALRLWTLMYRHVLDHHRRGGTWVFVHYDQVLDGSAAARLGAALGAPIDAGFPDESLRRSPPRGLVGAETQQLYHRLCSLAEYHPEAAAVAEA